MNVNEYPVHTRNQSTYMHTQKPIHSELSLDHLKVSLKQMCSQLSRRLSSIFLQHLREGSSQTIHFYLPPSYHICLIYSEVSLSSLLQDSYTVVNVFTFKVPPRLGRHIGLIYKWEPNTQCDFYRVPEEIYLKSRDQNLISLTTMGCSRTLRTALSCTENLHKTSYCLNHKTILGQYLCTCTFLSNSACTSFFCFITFCL